MHIKNSYQVVEILGPWLHNKGDDLMMRALWEQLAPGRTLATSSREGLECMPSGISLLQARWRPDQGEILGAFRSGSLRRGLGAIRRELVLRTLPDDALRRRGFVQGDQVSALLDCSGFAYGDQWSINRLVSRERHFCRIKHQGGALIMLPQALGPFDRTEVRDAAVAAFRHFDRIYARDRHSADHLAKLELPGDVIRTVPDITHLLKGRPLVDADKWKRRVCIVPNARMLDKTDPEIGKVYELFLLNSIRAVRNEGFEPYLMLHETNDFDLARRIAAGAGGDISVVDEDSVTSKGIIGASAAVISSRYHALVSALSQGVPVLGTSWAHKYDALFDEYDAAELLISPRLDMFGVNSAVEDILRPVRQNALRAKLAASAMRQREKVSKMWDEVELLINPHATY